LSIIRSQNRVADGNAAIEQLNSFVQQDFAGQDPLQVGLLFMIVGEFRMAERQRALAGMAFERAIESLSRAEGFRDVNAYRLRILIAYGNSLWLAGKPDSAVATLNEALAVLKRSPEVPNPDAYRVRIEYQLGISHMRAGDLDKAKTLIEAAVAESDIRTLTSGVLKDRLMALSRLRMVKRSGTSALDQVLSSVEIARETLPELRKIATSNNADHKTALRQILDEAPNEENSKTVMKLLNEAR
jgi:tetratricopeptide (TPR) repeat protein